MGLLSDVQEGLTEAFNDDLSDVVIPFSFVVITGESAYNSTTDSYDKVEELGLSRGIFDVINNRLVDGINIKIKDEMVIVNGPDLPAAPFVEPLIDMEIELANTKRYKIVDPGKIMGGDSNVIIYNMQVRKSGDGIKQ
tara:strand:- start:1107 stop:1520 length:414 start_codon:yes stop_codon:yes gene_type:complete